MSFLRRCTAFPPPTPGRSRRRSLLLRALGRPPLPSIALGLALGGAAVGLSGCGVSTSVYNQRTNDLRRCESDAIAYRNAATHRVTDLQRDKQELVRKRETLESELERLEVERAKLAANLSATKTEIEDLRRAHEQADLRNRTYRAVLERLQPAIAAGTVVADVAHGRLVVRLDDALLFDATHAQLKPSGQEALRLVAGALREIPDRDFLVAGHTDNSAPQHHGRFATNWELSAARAVEVVKFLQAAGVDPRRLGAAGFSEFRPAVDGEDETKQAANRRMEIIVLPNADEIPRLDEKDATTASRDSATP